ncbi:MAG: pyridoxal phosphate-dependent aminotransferase [Clostridia bacterium]|nr:pyridoxal phosphate-dependent aminotransferase [Clostridia bacterium]
MINKKMQGLGENSSVIRELFEYGKKRKAEIGADKVFDFSIGNPSVPCPDCVTESIKRIVSEKDATMLHGYTSAQGDIGVRTAIADYMNGKYGIGCEFSDIYMTVGAAASLTITLSAVAQKGEEVIVFAPFFPEYKVFVENSGADVKILTVDTKDFQVNIEEFENAITEKTAAVLVNSPNNPTGAILTEETLTKMADVLRKKQQELGKEIYLISDEPYRELVYGKECPLPINYYENTIVCYSYSKSLSLPGERIGYILVSPKMKDKKAVYAAVCGAGRSLGFVCAPSLWQFVIGENQGVTSDTSVYAENRKLLLDALTSFGFEAVNPDGAFYLFLKSPSGDATEFSERAKKQELLIVPSDSFGMGGYVRISYCVSRDQIVASIPAFEKLAKDYNLKD